ncbi:hypothetical protein ACFVJ4_32455, partial [Streptomyces sp. NPDC127178]|uniref:hypothetical protein n=1 Tax=Streptomyces sp. NPDC127178 TaxID=3345385 RepID=UPI00363D8381
ANPYLFVYLGLAFVNKTMRLLRSRSAGALAGRCASRTTWLLRSQVDAPSAALPEQQDFVLDTALR